MTILLICIAIVIIAGAASKKKDGPEGQFGNASDHFSRFNKSFCLTGGLRATTLDTAFKNALIVGSSGSGKTSCVLTSSIFSLCRSNTSMCILDVSSEVKKLTSGYMASKRNYKVYSFDLTETSDGFNPLDICLDPVSDSQKLAHILLRNGNIESKSDQYWLTSAENLSAIFIQYVVQYAPPEVRSMASVVRLLEVFAAEPAKIDKMMIATRNDKLLTSYKAANAVGEKTLQCTLSSALMGLKIFKHPAVSRCTAVSTFDFRTFRKEPSILYICIPVSDVAFMAPISAVLFENLFREVLSRIPDKSRELPIAALIDELLTMKLQQLGLVYSNCRKFRCAVMSLVQDEKMIEMNYSSSEAHAIKSNSYSKVYLKGQSPSSCKNLEEILGRYTYKEDGVEHTKKIMEAAQIRMSKKAIITLGSSKPLLETMTPFFEHNVLNARAKIPPYESGRKIPFDEPPLIPID